MLPKTVLYDGTDLPEPEPIHLRAGPLTLRFEPAEAFVRQVRFGGRDVLQGIYAAVRDRNWATILPKVFNLDVQKQEDSFRLSFDVECRQQEIDFFWRGEITGGADGTLKYTFDGQARSSFLRNRIGFCILHPVNCAGQPCIVETDDGRRERGMFPRYISPHQPFKNMRAIAHEVQPGVTAEVRFEGEVFEMEDQRNWTDASFKTYCTPLERPFPVQVPQGQRIQQSVTLRLEGRAPREEVIPGAGAEEIRLTAGGDPIGPLPRIGLETAGPEHPLNPHARQRLAALNLAHLRAELKLHEPDLAEELKRAWGEAEMLNLPLEAALFVSDNAERELEAFAEQLQQVRPQVARWLIFHINEKSTTEKWIHPARAALKRYDPAIPIFSGTNAYFTELNRGRPPVQVLDGICYSINPQVHAFDNRSLVETLALQAETVRSARQFIGDLPLAITPVSLRPRFNPNATAAETSPPGELPSQVDVRQMSLLGAGWTLGSVKYLAESGVESVTYYQTVGWRGVMETETGSRPPQRFRSLPDGVFPLYHVLADVGEFAGGEVCHAASSDPLAAEIMAIRKGNRLCLLIANLTSRTRHVGVKAPLTSPCLRRLNENNAEEAMRSPQTFRNQEGEPAETEGSFVKLSLRPYAVARIDGDLET